MKLPNFSDYCRIIRLRARGWMSDGDDGYWRRPLRVTDDIQSNGFDVYCTGDYVYASDIDWAEKVDAGQSPPETH